MVFGEAYMETFGLKVSQHVSAVKQITAEAHQLTGSRVVKLTHPNVMDHLRKFPISFKIEEEFPTEYEHMRPISRIDFLSSSQCSVFTVCQVLHNEKC
jgi:hypothetical protein